MTSERPDEGVDHRRGLALMAGIAMVAFLLMLTVQRWHSEREELSANLKTQASIIGVNASAAIVFGDARAATEILAALTKSPLVLEAALYKADGEALSSFLRPGPDEAPRLDKQAANVGIEYSLTELRVTVPVTLDEREVGLVTIRGTQKYLNHELANYLLAQLSALSIAVALAYLATRRLRRRISLARGQLETSRSMLQQLLVRRETLLEEEHRRIAIEIHDQLGQILTTALLNLRLLERSTDKGREEMLPLIKDVEAQLEEAYKGMKDIAANLHPVVLEFGFHTALEWLSERILGPAGIKAFIDVPSDGLPLDVPQSLALFRIAQEALSNTVRHSAATAVWISLNRSASHLTFEVADNGKGFDTTAGSNMLHFGLLGINQRAGSIGGRLEIDSAPGEGTRIRVTLECAAPVRGLKGTKA